MEEEILSELVRARVPQHAEHYADSIRRLVRDGASPAVSRRYVEAVEVCEPPLPAEDPTRAKSAAEAFRFSRLESLEESAGEFELNGYPGFAFGRLPAEVDLLAAGPRIAVEIDGYYHFRDSEAYRRDRRKDLLLQQNGFLVIRFLAEDVVEHLEEILDTILSELRSRREKE